MRYLVLLITCVLMGCSILPEGPEPLPLYTLKPVVPLSPPLPGALGVELPRCDASLDTPRIAITHLPYRRDYLANGQWSDHLPNALLECFMTSFSEAWGGAAVGRMDEGITVTDILYTHIDDFAFYPDCQEVRIKLSLKLVDFQNRKPIAGRIVEARIKAPFYSMSGIMAAFNKGLQDVLIQSTQWIHSVYKVRS